MEEALRKLRILETRVAKIQEDNETFKANMRARLRELLEQNREMKRHIDEYAELTKEKIELLQEQNRLLEMNNGDEV